jgi:hypothetical protein
MKKTPHCPQNLKNKIFLIKCQILDIFLGAEALSNSLETLVSQKRRKIRPKSAKKVFR